MTCACEASAVVSSIQDQCSVCAGLRGDVTGCKKLHARAMIVQGLFAAQRIPVSLKVDLTTQLARFRQHVLCNQVPVLVCILR